MAAKLADSNLENDRQSKPTLFSNAFINHMNKKIVQTGKVLERLFDTNVLNEAEMKSINEELVFDKKLKTMMKIIEKHCRNKNLKVLESFIGVLKGNKDKGNQDKNLVTDLQAIHDGQMTLFKTQRELKDQKGLVYELRSEIERLSIELAKKVDEVNALKILSQKNESNQKQYEMQIIQKDEIISALKKRLGELEKKVKNMTISIKERENYVLAKEKELEDSIIKSNEMSTEVQILKDRLDEVTCTEEENLLLSKKIEELENEIKTNESRIQDLNRSQTLVMTRGDIEDFFSNTLTRFEKLLQKK
ncbi:uncharacterized protein LOC143041842 [Mytilus galloprovincialis]|uniref:uncharacterized protein LOC143041842 n=1 Tax=Mytilus galloprovincialis TaxID=29158 RepID=UPI003F7C1370